MFVGLGFRLQEFGVRTWLTPGPVTVQVCVRPVPLTTSVVDTPERTREGVALMDTDGAPQVAGRAVHEPPVRVPECEYPQESVHENPVQVLAAQELSGVQLGSGSPGPGSGIPGSS